MCKSHVQSSATCLAMYTNGAEMSIPNKVTNVSVSSPNTLYFQMRLDTIKITTKPITPRYGASFGGSLIRGNFIWFNVCWVIMAVDLKFICHSRKRNFLHSTKILVLIIEIACYGNHGSIICRKCKRWNVYFPVVFFTIIVKSLS